MRCAELQLAMVVVVVMMADDDDDPSEDTYKYACIRGSERRRDRDHKQAIRRRMVR